MIFLFFGFVYVYMFICLYVYMFICLYVYMFMFMFMFTLDSPVVQYSLIVTHCYLTSLILWNLKTHGVLKAITTRYFSSLFLLFLGLLILGVISFVYLFVSLISFLFKQTGKYLMLFTTIH